MCTHCSTYFKGCWHIWANRPMSIISPLLKTLQNCPKIKAVSSVQSSRSYTTCPHLLPLLPAQSAPHTARASSLFLQYTNHGPASGPLHRLCPLLGMPFLQMVHDSFFNPHHFLCLPSLNSSSHHYYLLSQPFFSLHRIYTHFNLILIRCTFAGLLIKPRSLSGSQDLC